MVGRIRHVIDIDLEKYVVAVLLPNLSVGQLRGPFGLRKFVSYAMAFFGSDSKLMELQNFSQLIVSS